jgi:hypothetical protein
MYSSIKAIDLCMDVDIMKLLTIEDLFRAYTIHVQGKVVRVCKQYETQM